MYTGFNSYIWTCCTGSSNGHNDNWFDGMKRAAFFLAVFIITYLLCAMLGGCRSVKIIENATVKHDTCYVDRLQRDSIHVHDSIYMKEWMCGDTVYQWRDRWHTKWREKLVHDSIYISKTDTVKVVETVAGEPQRTELTWWQKTRIHAGDVFMGIMGVLMIIGILRLRMKFI